MSNTRVTNRWEPIDSPGTGVAQPLTVLYIPGFLSGNEPQTVAIDLLKQIFPAPNTVTSLAWEGPASNRNLTVREESENRSPDADFLLSNDPTDALLKAWQSFVVSSDLLTNEAVSAPMLKVMDFLTKEKWLLSPLQSVLSPIFDQASKLLPTTFLTRWNNAKHDTDTVSEALANKIIKATNKEQKGLFLIGHSLGANIVVKTLARLSAKNVKIYQAALLGAAIDNDDPSIEPALEAVLNPINLTINPYDHALMLYALCNMGHSALGSTGYTGTSKQLQEYHLGVNQNAPNIEHSSSFYIKQWDSLRIK